MVHCRALPVQYSLQQLHWWRLWTCVLCDSATFVWAWKDPKKVHSFDGPQEWWEAHWLSSLKWLHITQYIWISINTPCPKSLTMIQTKTHLTHRLPHHLGQLRIFLLAVNISGQTTSTQHCTILYETPVKDHGIILHTACMRQACPSWTASPLMSVPFKESRMRWAAFCRSWSLAERSPYDVRWQCCDYRPLLVSHYKYQQCRSLHDTLKLLDT